MSEKHASGEGDERQRRKRSRWGDETPTEKGISGLQTVIPSNLTPLQQQCYLLHLRIEDANVKLRTGNLGISEDPDRRSPSPEPMYNHEGKRLNTREYRHRKRIEQERHDAVQEMMKLNPQYHPPADYRPPEVKIQDKVYIPYDKHPEINFMGLLIGPRGNTMKKIEKETGAKVMIRGKGTVKEGKGKPGGQYQDNEDEPMHAFVTAPNPESLKKCVEKLSALIYLATECPEAENELKRIQLRELAALNGTLREEDVTRCKNCGNFGHKQWQCTERNNFVNTATCSVCGGIGHLPSDCKFKKDEVATAAPQDQAKIDSEYMSLMAELGEGPKQSGGLDSSAPPPWAIKQETPRPQGGALLAQPAAPWASQPAQPAPWANQAQQAPPAPWAQYPPPPAGLPYQNAYNPYGGYPPGVPPPPPSGLPLPPGSAQ